MDINLIDADIVMNMCDGLGLGALDMNSKNDDLVMDRHFDRLHCWLLGIYDK
jgi:hypothetical protein